MKKYIISKNYAYFTAVILLMISIATSCIKEEQTPSDTINPYVISYNPVSGVDGIATNSNLVLTFDDILVKGEGKITITTTVEQGTQIIDINDASVTISNVARILTINPSKDLFPGMDYTVVIDAGIVQDLAGNKYFGMPDNEVWKFTTGGNAGDFEAPALVSSTPTNNETGASITELKLKFNEAVKTDEGAFVFFDKGTGAELFRIDAKSTEVVVNKTDITISHSLEFGKNYYVQVAEGVIKDASGNSFPGFTTQTAWNFSTTAGSGSDLIVHIPFNGNMADVSGNKFNALKGTLSTVDVEYVSDAVRGPVAHFLAGSYAQLPRHDLLRPTTTKSFSFNFWIKLAGIGSDPSLFSNKNWDGGGNPGFVLCTNDGNTYSPTVPGSGDGWKLNCANDAKTARLDWAAANTKPVPAPAISDNKWHMVTGVFNSATLKMSVYIDGKSYGDAANASSYDLSKIAGKLYDATNDYPITLFEDGSGVYNSGDTDRKLINGYMDELSVYGKALTDAEVTALFAL